MSHRNKNHRNTNHRNSPSSREDPAGEDHSRADRRQQESPSLVLTDAERARIGQRASQGLIRALVAQAGMAVFAVVLSGLLAGEDAALSALIGAAAYFVPNALFAMRLLAGMFGPMKSGPMAFFWGEAFKLGTAVLILGLAAWKGGGWLVWPALLLGLLCVLKGYVLLLAFRKMP